MRGLVKYLALTCMCMVLTSYSADAFWPFGKNKKKPETEQASAPKKTPYQKFLAKRGLVCRHSGISIYRDGKDIYLEMPDSLAGGKLVFGSYIKESCDLNLSPNTDVTGRFRTFIYTRTDSLALFSLAQPTVIYDDGSNSAMRSVGRVLYGFPIKYRNADSTACLFKVNEMFDLSKDGTLWLPGNDFNGGMIVESTIDGDLTEIEDVMAFEDAVAVLQNATFEVGVRRSFGKDNHVSATIVSTLSVAKKSSLPLREADSRVGVRTMQVKSFNSARGVETRTVACRWDLNENEPVRIYVDTLLPVAWQNAVRDGIEAWNPAFQRIGYGKAFTVLPFPSDSTFSAFDPRNNIVSFNNGFNRDMSARIRTDSNTGEIYGMTITIPGDYVSNVRYASSFAIGDVDPRYFTYNIDEEAVCEVLKAQVMRTFGKCIGLVDNPAGSFAYSPQELTNPEFTKSHGITASVMDDVLFNYLARPGDKERGVVTVVDRIGPYDCYAVEWLYRKFSETADEKASLDSLVTSHQGDREYLYLPASKGYPDPRTYVSSLGNDPFAAFDAAMSHVKYAMANADDWMTGDNIPNEGFRELYVENLWLRMASCSRILGMYIGGMYISDVRAGGPEPRFVPVPAKIQKKAVEKIVETYTDVSWMDSNRRLKNMSGIYVSYGPFTILNAIGQGALMSRIGYVSRAQRLAASQYGVDEFLDDLQAAILKNAKSGQLQGQEEGMINIFIRNLIALSPVWTAKFLEFSKGDKNALNSTSDFKGLTVDLSGVPMEDLDCLTIIAQQRLRRIRTDLAAGRTLASDPYVKGKLSYLINMIDYTLE